MRLFAVLEYVRQVDKKIHVIIQMHKMHDYNLHKIGCFIQCRLYILDVTAFTIW